MSRRTQIPTYDVAARAQEYDKTSRVTVIPVAGSALAFQVEQHVRVPFDFSEVPVWGRTSGPSGESKALDYSEAFLMLNIDGISSFETVIRLSHVEPTHAVAALMRMLSVGLIAVKGRPIEPAEPLPTAEDPSVASGLWRREDFDVEHDERWSLTINPPPRPEGDDILEASESEPDELFEPAPRSSTRHLP